MEKIYITSNKYSLRERDLNTGKVYDVVFRIYTFDKEEKQKRLCGFKSKALAKKGYLEFVNKYCEVLKEPLRKKQKEFEKSVFNLHIADLFPVYISNISGQTKNSSIYEIKNTFNIYILPYFKNKTITELDKQTLYAWQDNLWGKINPKTKQPYSYLYLSKIRSCFSAFLTWCENRYDVRNCFANVKKPKKRVQKTDMLFWTKEEFLQFISVVDNLTYKTFFTTLFYTGRRKGEVLALYPSDIKANKITFNKNISRKTLNGEPFEVTSTKNEKKDATPICATLQSSLNEYRTAFPESNKFTFFFGGNKPLAENTVTRYFNRYIEKANVKKIRIHDLRHSFVSMCIHLGASVYVVADLIGDTVEQVLQTYGHLYEEDKLNIIAQL
jgi:integrase